MSKEQLARSLEILSHPEPEDPECAKLWGPTRFPFEQMIKPLGRRGFTAFGSKLFVQVYSQMVTETDFTIALTFPCIECPDYDTVADAEMAEFWNLSTFLAQSPDQEDTEIGVIYGCQSRVVCFNNGLFPLDPRHEYEESYNFIGFIAVYRSAHRLTDHPPFRDMRQLGCGGILNQLLHVFSAVVQGSMSTVLLLLNKKVSEEVRDHESCWMLII